MRISDWSSDVCSSDLAAPEFDLELRGKTRRSIGWTITRTLSDQLFSFTVFVVLAQLLTREEIGIFAMAYVFAEIGRIVATSGHSQPIGRASCREECVSTCRTTGPALHYTKHKTCLCCDLLKTTTQP